MPMVNQKNEKKGLKWSISSDKSLGWNFIDKRNTKIYIL